ncbi:hypothetical protein GCM10017771_50660 [Streptomyces capitiformicae]|uniref:Transposase putative helix-turn-helix domain-containing protein n=1 Tax=Streptomyces capitiformicae TaxID=2014920 RepID=A0A918Z2B1_9ACTN|nr:hypothetical protein GCM10017771_50660 [Streptomyces capitiformicae]
MIGRQLRYAFRLYPNAGQRTAPARAFGCARVVFNDAVRAREDARKAGQPFPTAGQLSGKLTTEVKQTKERSWLGCRTGGIGLRSAGKTRSNPGTARRNRKPRNPHRKPRRVTAQQPVEKARIRPERRRQRLARPALVLLEPPGTA